MPEWTRLFSALSHISQGHVKGSWTAWSSYVVVGIALLLAVMVLWDDWRWGMICWLGVSTGVTVLLTDRLPLPWALSRLVAASVDGALLWLGARRWPRVPSGSRWGLLPRLALLSVGALITYQLREYTFLLWTDPIHADAVLVLLMGGMLLLLAGGNAFHGTLGILMFIHAGVLLLAPLPMPRDWIYPLTLLDVVTALVGSVALAGEGAWARAQLRERLP